MIEILLEDNDAEPFLRLVEGTARGICRTHAPDELIVIRIDNRFDHKWLRFSGKALIAHGTWKRRFTLPHFVPDRVRWQRRYRRVPASYDYRLVDPEQFLHIRQWAAKNQTRFAARLVPDTAVLWFSGNSGPNGRGGLMVHVPTPEGHWPRYSGVSATGDWRPGKLKGITGEAFRCLARAPSVSAAPG